MPHLYTAFWETCLLFLGTWILWKHSLQKEAPSIGEDPRVTVLKFFTPKIPEYRGNEEILLLGDQYVAGIGATVPENGLLGYLSAIKKTGIWSAPALSAKDVPDLFRDAQRFHNETSKIYRAIIVSIGEKDALEKSFSAEKFREELQEIVYTLLPFTERVIFLNIFSAFAQAVREIDPRMQLIQEKLLVNAFKDLEAIPGVKSILPTFSSSQSFVIEKGNLFPSDIGYRDTYCSLQGVVRDLFAKPT